MAWLLILIAGLLEACWSLGLKLSDGFTRPAASVVTVAAILLSCFCFSLAVRTLPIGPAYAVWVGIGVAGAMAFGVVFLRQRATATQWFFTVLLVVALVGLKMSSAAPEE